MFSINYVDRRRIDPITVVRLWLMGLLFRACGHIFLRAALGPELGEAVEYARAAKSPATRRAYRSDFEIFRTWCEEKRLCPLPASAEAVAAFLAFDLTNGAKPPTLSRRLAAISYAHTLAGHPSPTASEAVKATLRGIKRTFRHSPARKAPATSDKVAAMVALAGDGPRGLRDRALLLVGFAGAFRRSELIALNLEDLESCEHGLLVTIRKSKTDQEGVGARNRDAVRGPRGVSGECGTPLDSSKSDREWSNLSTRQQRKSSKSPSFRSLRRRSGEGLCSAGWVEGGGFQRPLPEVGLSDVGRSAWRVDFQNDGCQPGTKV